MVISSTLARLSTWKEYYIIYNNRLFYVFGLVFSRSMTNYALVNVLVWYFTYYEGDLVMSAILSNFRDSLSSLLVIFLATAADSYVGRFHTLLFSNVAYIFGLMLLWMFNPYDVIWLVLIIMLLLALGTSGDQLLQQVLEDMVNDIDKSQDQTKKRSFARARIWSRILKIIAAIVTIVFVAPHDSVVRSTWKSSFLICVGFMATCSIIFCIGHNSYHQGQLYEGPLSVFFRHMHIKKLLKHKSRRVNDSSRLDGSLHNLGTENREGEGIMPESRQPVLVDTKGQEASGCSSNKQDDIVIVKSLSRMFPIWGIFFFMSLISATGSTFFLQQYKNLNTTNKIAVQIYDLLRDVSSFAILFLYRWSCGLRKNERVKFGVGLLFGIVSCLFAWQLEVQRIKKVKKIEEVDANTSLSFLWLMPQFCVLGCMEGLTWDGLLKFYESQIKEEPLQSYGEEYTEVVSGFGTTFHIILILFSKNILGWFGNKINDSRLDYYYLVLACFGLANFIVYCLIARYYYKDAEQHQDSVNNDSNQQGLELVPCGNHEQDNQLPANGDHGQDIQLVGNDDKEQDNQEQDNQLLPNGDDQKQDNHLLTADELQQAR